MKKILFLSALVFNMGFANEPLRIGIGLAKPPFIMDNLNSGIEIDIVRESLKNANIDFKFEAFPQSRLLQSYLLKKIDAMITIKDNPDDKTFLSDAYVTFENVFVSKKAKKIHVTNIDDLKKLDVGAFQNASIFMGDAFRNLSNNSKVYHEFALQQDQVKMLVADRIDGIVLEKNIVIYYLNMYGQKLSDYQFDKIFPKNSYRVAFRNKEIRDRFNIGLQHLKKASQDKAIYQRYLKEVVYFNLLKVQNYVSQI